MTDTAKPLHTTCPPGHLLVEDRDHFNALTAEFTNPDVAATRCPCTDGDKCLRLGPFQCPCCGNTNIGIHSDTYMATCARCHLVADADAFLLIEVPS